MREIPRGLLAGIGLAGVCAAAAFALTHGPWRAEAAVTPGDADKKSVHAARAHRVARNGDVGRGGETAASGSASPSSGRRALEFYTQEVRGSLFSPPEPPAPPKANVAPAPAKSVEKPRPVPLPTVAPVNPYADWSYTGTVKMGTEIIALLENGKAKEGQYVRIGDAFLGGRIAAITDDSVQIEAAGKPTMLAKSDAITVTPFDKSSNGNAAGPTPVAATPGVMISAPSLMVMPNKGNYENLGGKRRGSWAEMSEEERAQRRQEMEARRAEFMNKRWNR